MNTTNNRHARVYFIVHLFLIAKAKRSNFKGVIAS